MGKNTLQKMDAVKYENRASFAKSTRKNGQVYRNKLMYKKCAGGNL